VAAVVVKQFLKVSAHDEVVLEVDCHVVYAAMLTVVWLPSIIDENVLYVGTDVGVTKPGRHVVDDASVQWKCSTTYHARLWLQFVPAVWRLHYVSRPCILWQPISVSNIDWYFSHVKLLFFIFLVVGKSAIGARNYCVSITSEKHSYPFLLSFFLSLSLFLVVYSNQFGGGNAHYKRQGLKKLEL